MKIRVLPRIFFERIKDTPTEVQLLEENKIISIVSSSGYDCEPPFTERLLRHPHLLCLTFDDTANEPEGPEDIVGCVYFDINHAEQIMRFVDDGAWPLLIHCTAGISRSGAVGEVLDWYFNHFVSRNNADHRDFLENNRQIFPNPIVRRRMLEYLRSN